MENDLSSRLENIESMLDITIIQTKRLVAENKELKLVLTTLIPYMETSARIIKELTGEDIPEDDAKYIEMAKELVIM